jgi:hypothetical protein
MTTDTAKEVVEGLRQRAQVALQSGTIADHLALLVAVDAITTLQSRIEALEKALSGVCNLRSDCGCEISNETIVAFTKAHAALAKAPQEAP